MEAPTFEWREGVLVISAGDWSVAFSAEQMEKPEGCVEMGAWTLWTRGHPEKLEGMKKLKSTLDKLQGHAIPQSVMAEVKQVDDLEFDRLEYIGKAQEAYLRFADLTT